MCSLKEAGFAGRHRCGVTLLSGEMLLQWIRIMKWNIKYLFISSQTDKLKTFRTRNIRGCPCVCSTLQLHVQGSFIIRRIILALKYPCLGRGRQCGWDLLLPRPQPPRILSPKKLLLWKKSNSPSSRTFWAQYRLLWVLAGCSTGTSISRKRAGSENFRHHQLPNVQPRHKWGHWRKP